MRPLYLGPLGILVQVVVLGTNLGAVSAFATNTLRGNTVPKTSLEAIRRRRSTALSTSKEPSVPSQLENIVKNAKKLVPFGYATPPAKNTNKYWQATVAGLAVSLAMVPEAVAFAFVAGVNPLTGLWTTVILGFVAALLGGRPGICSSASGACSVVVASLCASHGASYLSACAILAGILQTVAGGLNLGKYIRLVPHPVMLGFVNGLAIVMTKAQLGHFRTAAGQWLSPTNAAGASVYGVTALTMILAKLMPKFTKAIPASLGAVVLSTIFTKLLKLPVQTLADVAGASTFTGGMAVLPALGVPAVPQTLQTLQTIFPYAITMASVGCIESLLTMQLLDGMVDDGKRGSTRRECYGQGLGNILSGLFGGIGGCALLGQSIINVQSGGGVSRWSGMSMAVFLALGIVAFSSLLGTVPVASLVGIMLLVCYSTFSWSSLRILNKIPKLDAFVIALVSVVTIQRDLAAAVISGTIASALGFCWKQSTRLTASESMEGDKKLYNFDGPLFFGTTQSFADCVSPKSDPSKVILDFTGSRVMDHSGLVAIQEVADQYGSQDKTVYLRHLSKDCTVLLKKLYKDNNLPSYEMIETDETNDPVYGIGESDDAYSNVPAT